VERAKLWLPALQRTALRLSQIDAAIAPGRRKQARA
jgi:hypothetical protein